MKTKTFLLLCLFLGIGLTQLSAQSSDPGSNRSYSYNGQVWGWFPLYCDGVHEKIYTTLDVHFVEQYKNGVRVDLITQWKGEATSSTGEIFKWSEVDKYTFNDNNKVFHNDFHGNLIGNEGSHYIISGSVDYSVRPVIVTIDKAVCLENEHK